MDIKQFIENHRIIQIGNTISGYLYCDVIVDNPCELIYEAEKNGCYISEIRWWDHAEIRLGSLIGYGGPRDPKDPAHYFYAETDICKKFDKQTEPQAYFHYLKKTKEAYSDFDICPAFDIQ